MSDKPRWVLELEPIRPPRNPERQLARALKVLSRAYNLRCVKVGSIDTPDDERRTGHGSGSLSAGHQASGGSTSPGSERESVRRHTESEGRTDA